MNWQLVVVSFVSAFVSALVSGYIASRKMRKERERQRVRMGLSPKHLDARWAWARGLVCKFKGHEEERIRVGSVVSPIYCKRRCGWEKP